MNTPTYIWEIFLNILTFMGGWSTIRTILFLILRHNEKDHYIESDLKYKFNTDFEKLSTEEPIPISTPITLQEDSRTITLIRFPGQTMKNIKIFEFSENQNYLNKFFITFLEKVGNTYLFSKNKNLYDFIDRVKSKLMNFDKLYKLYDIPELTIQSEEYLAIQTELAEGIPQFRIECRVNGKKIKFYLQDNGKYGARDKKFVKIHYDLYSLIYDYFRSPI